MGKPGKVKSVSNEIIAKIRASKESILLPGEPGKSKTYILERLRGVEQDKYVCEPDYFTAEPMFEQSWNIPKSVIARAKKIGLSEENMKQLISFASEKMTGKTAVKKKAADESLMKDIGTILTFLVKGSTVGVGAVAIHYLLKNIRMLRGKGSLNVRPGTLKVSKEAFSRIIEYCKRNNIKVFEEAQRLGKSGRSGSGPRRGAFEELKKNVEPSGNKHDDDDPKGAGGGGGSSSVTSTKPSSSVAQKVAVGALVGLGLAGLGLAYTLGAPITVPVTALGAAAFSLFVTSKNPQEG